MRRGVGVVDRAPATTRFVGLALILTHPRRKGATIVPLSHVVAPDDVILAEAR